MKYQIDTIPVLKAFEEQSECPLCLLQDKAEKAGVKYYLGHSVMVPEVRIKLNETGFCGRHFSALLNSKESRLGLALMAHTRALNIIEKMKKKGYNWQDSAKVDLQRCPLCNEVDQTLKRYAATIAWLWDNEPEFSEMIGSSKGFCHRHFPLLLETGPSILPRKKYKSYSETLCELQIKETERIASEIEWYTKKFDAANKDAPWGSSKDALPRTVAKLAGFQSQD